MSRWANVPPVDRDFVQMTPSELAEYDTWFHGVMPRRVEELRRTVVHTRGFEAWPADFSPDSLLDLGKWLATQVRTRKTTPRERTEARRDLPGIAVERTNLTDATYATAVDVGMYFACVLQASRPDLRWSQALSDRADVNFGQPVLLGLHSPLNPIAVSTNLALGLAAGTERSTRLRELFDVWTMSPDEVERRFQADLADMKEEIRHQRRRPRSTRG